MTFILYKSNLDYLYSVSLWAYKSNLYYLYSVSLWDYFIFTVTAIIIYYAYLPWLQELILFSHFCRIEWLVIDCLVLNNSDCWKDREKFYLRGILILAPKSWCHRYKCARVSLSVSPKIKPYCKQAFYFSGLCELFYGYCRITIFYDRHSTVTHVLDSINSKRPAQRTLLTTIDISKAFGAIPRHRLTDKLYITNMHNNTKTYCQLFRR